MKLLVLVGLFICSEAFGQMLFEPCFMKKQYDQNPSWDPEWPVGVVKGHTFRKKDICIPMTTRLRWKQSYLKDSLNYQHVSYIHTFKGEAWYRDDTKDLVLVGNAQQFSGTDLLIGANGSASYCKDSSCRQVVRFGTPNLEKLMNRYTTNWEFARPTVEVEGETVPESFFAQINGARFTQGNDYLVAEDVSIENLDLAKELSARYDEVIEAMSARKPFSFKLKYAGNENAEDSSLNHGEVDFKLYFGCPTKAEIVQAEPQTDNMFVFSSTTPGVVRMDYLINIENYPQENDDMQVTWEVPEKDGSILDYNKTGPSTVIHYTGLPVHNADMGHTPIFAKVKVEGCESFEIKSDARIFFPRDYNNSPDPTVPNWFYYWSQTPAAPGLAVNDDFYYKANCQIPDTGTERESEIVQFNDKKYKRLLKQFSMCDLNAMTAPHIYTPVLLPGPFTNIDAYALFILRSKIFYDYFFSTWMTHYGWPVEIDSTNPAMTDVDQDYIPDRNEQALSYDPERSNTYGITVGAAIYNDALHMSSSAAEASWPKGSADQYDWAKPGNQWNEP